MNFEDITKQIIREKTKGLGVDIVIDFQESHTNEDKKNIITTLAPHGKWVICDEQF